MVDRKDYIIQGLIQQRNNALDNLAACFAELQELKQKNSDAENKKKTESEE